MKRSLRCIFPFFVLIGIGLFVSPFICSQEDWTAEWKKQLKKYPPSLQAVELKEILSFGDAEEEDYYLWQPRVMALDDEGNSYVIDSKWCALFKFDAQGRFVAKTGRKGQGPGEFQIPVWIGFHDKYIFICDNGRHEIMIFNQDLIFERLIPIRNSYCSLSISSKGLICGVSLGITKTDPLINVLDENGILLRAFGIRSFGNDNNWQVPNFAFIDINQNDEIYLAFWEYPTVCKFTLEGELIARYEIDSKYMKDAGRQNHNALGDPQNRTSWTAISGLRALEDGFCLLQEYPYTGIHEFDSQGRRIKEYWTAKSYDYMESDFIVRKTGQITIYILTSGPRSRVEVFQPKR